MRGEGTPEVFRVPVGGVTGGHPWSLGANLSIRPIDVSSVIHRYVLWTIRAHWRFSQNSVAHLFY